MKTLRRFSKHPLFSQARIMAAVLLILTAAAMIFIAASPPAVARPTARTQPLTPKFSTAVAFDVSPAVRDLPPAARPLVFDPNKIVEVRPERGPEVQSKGYSGDGALQTFSSSLAIPAPLLTFEGLANADNLALYGFRLAHRSFTTVLPSPRQEILPGLTSATRSPRASSFQIIPSTECGRTRTCSPRAISVRRQSTASASMRWKRTK